MNADLESNEFPFLFEKIPHEVLKMEPVSSYWLIVKCDRVELVQKHTTVLQLEFVYPSQTANIFQVETVREKGCAGTTL